MAVMQVPVDIMREGNDLERQRRGWLFFHPFVSFSESSQIWCENKGYVIISTQRKTEGSASRGQHLTLDLFQRPLQSPL